MSAAGGFRWLLLTTVAYAWATSGASVAAGDQPPGVRPAGAAPLRLAFAPQDARPPGSTVRAADSTVEAGDEGDDEQRPAARPATKLPEVADIQAQLDAAAADETLEEGFKTRLVSTLRSTLELLASLEKLRRQEATYRERREHAPQQLEQVRQAAQRQRPEPSLPTEATRANGPLDMETIQTRVTEAIASANTARDELQQFEAEQREQTSRAAELPARIAEARAAAEEASATTIGELDGDPEGTLRAARQHERAVRIEVARQRVNTLLAEQAMIEAESELLPLRVQVARQRAQRATETQRLWTELRDSQRQYRVQEDLNAHHQLIRQRSIAPERSLILQLGPDWIDLLADNASLQRKMASARQRFDELDAEYQEVKSQIDRDLASAEGLRPGLGMKLLRTRQRLPGRSALRTEIREMDEAIERARMLQTEAERLREDLRDAARGRRSPLAAALSELPIDEELRLIDRLIANTDDHISDLIELKSQLELKLARNNEFRALIDENVIWIRDAAALRPTRIPQAFRTFRRMLAPADLVDVGYLFAGEVRRRIDLVIGWILLAMLPWAMRPRLRQRLGRLNHVAESPLHYPVTTTLAALAIELLITIPAAVTLAFAGLLLIESAQATPLASALGEAVFLAAIAVLPLLWLREVLAPKGLFESHFRLSDERARPARSAARRALFWGVPLVVLWSLASNATLAQGDDTLARLVFIGGMMVLSGFTWRAFHPESGVFADYLREHPGGWLGKLRWLWHALTLLPLVLAGLSLAGYTYAGVLMAQRLYWSFCFAIVVWLVASMITRYLRWRLERARQAALELGAESNDGGALEAGETQHIDDVVDVIDEQTHRLIISLLWITILVGVVWLWAPVLPAIGFLDRVHLWDTTAVDGTIKKITLGNLVIAVPIVVLAVVAVRNVPGLIESMLLERLPLDKPARYAITSLASYALALIGIILTTRTLGLRWESIQWLVAALGVGLGFGLQEIFANFVSGLIILFEQPIRVGDVVTIGDTTGTVTRIRIRSTVVRNWDRQELIIPNKDLITERLINWTLSDTTNRLELRVGVAYGSDVPLACRLLEQVCNQHDNVLIDPKPVIVFEGFGDSTLMLVARCFLGGLDDRLRTMHELNLAIDERFKAAGLEIAFPQRDLHIRSLPPDWHAREGRRAAPLASDEASSGNERPSA